MWSVSHLSRLLKICFVDSRSLSIYQLKHWAKRYCSFQRSSEQVGRTFLSQLHLDPFLLAAVRALWCFCKLYFCFLLWPMSYVLQESSAPSILVLRMWGGVNQCKQQPCDTIDVILVCDNRGQFDVVWASNRQNFFFAYCRWRDHWSQAGD